MYKYECGRNVYAGTNEIHRWGRKAIERVSASLVPNESGYYSIPVDGGKYWTIGTSAGKYGEFAKLNGTIFSVNNAGYAYAKVGTEKGDLFVKAIEAMVEEMRKIHSSTAAENELY